jgi:hypothetical protein
MSEVISLLPQYAFRVWYSAKAQGQLYLYLYLIFQFVYSIQSSVRIPFLSHANFKPCPFNPSDLIILSVFGEEYKL